MTVNILMTVYNDGDRLLNKSITSILGQTYQDFKFIIVNDGSNDSTHDLIQKYVNEDNRIIYINRKDNKGRVFSLNEGLQSCEEDLIFINDADDISTPNRIELCIEEYNKLNNTDGSFGLLGTAFVSHEVKKNKKTTYLLKTGAMFRKSFPMWRLLLSMPFPHSSVMYRRKALLEVGGFSKEVSAGIDYLTLLKIANKYKIYGLNEVLVERIIDGNNFFMQKKINDLNSENTRIIQEWQKKNINLYMLKKLPSTVYTLFSRVRIFLANLLKEGIY